MKPTVDLDLETWIGVLHAVEFKSGEKGRKHSEWGGKRHEIWKFITCLRSMSGLVWLRHKGMEWERGEVEHVG